MTTFFYLPSRDNYCINNISSNITLLVLISNNRTYDIDSDINCSIEHLPIYQKLQLLVTVQLLYFTIYKQLKNYFSIVILNEDNYCTQQFCTLGYNISDNIYIYIYRNGHEKKIVKDDEMCNFVHIPLLFETLKYSIIMLWCSLFIIQSTQLLS